MNMTAEEIRNANWDDLRESVTQRMLDVHAALLAVGPLTTRELAGAMGHTLEYTRPRVTELCQMGLAVCIGRRRRGRVNEGVYEARTMTEWRQAHQRLQAAEEQVLMPF